MHITVAEAPVQTSGSHLSWGGGASWGWDLVRWRIDMKIQGAQLAVGKQEWRRALSSAQFQEIEQYPDEEKEPLKIKQ